MKSTLITAVALSGALALAGCGSSGSSSAPSSSGGSAASSSTTSNAPAATAGSTLPSGDLGARISEAMIAIHDFSRRAAHRFLVVAGGANSGHFLASEFFGHSKGAFSGADAGKVGKFEAAGAGTLLIDEIDALALDQQANLLRVIESGEFEPVGSNETQRSNARIIVATNWNLSEAVALGTFRNDLYYRLNVLPFRIPPLRDRLQDVSPLVRGMVARYNTRFAKRIGGIHPETMRALEVFPWPGNIRQLENVIQQAVLTCTGDELRLQHLPPIVHTLRAEPMVPVSVTTPGPAGSLAHNRETTERVAILRALEKVTFSRTRAAELLGVSRVTLYKKMKKYGLLGKPTGGAAPPYEQQFSRVGGS